MLMSLKRSHLTITMKLCSFRKLRYISYIFRCSFRERGNDFSFFEYLSQFCFLLIEFYCTFSISYKYDHILLIIIVFWLGCDTPSGGPSGGLI